MEVVTVEKMTWVLIGLGLAGRRGSEREREREKRERELGGLISDF